MKKRTKKTLSMAAKVFTRMLLATVLCAILFISMEVISFAFFNEEVGYQIYDAKNTEVDPITYYYQAGEEVQTADSLGLTDDQTFIPLMKVPAAAANVMRTIAQILMIVVFCIFPYHILWEFGNRDDTNVRYRGQRPDPWRGFKIGGLAVTPFVVAWVVLLVSKFIPAMANYLMIYRVIMFPYWWYNDWMLAGALSITDAALWRLLLLILPILLVIPLTCMIAYRMGGNQFSITEFLTFAKKQEVVEDDEI